MRHMLELQSTELIYLVRLYYNIEIYTYIHVHIMHTVCVYKLVIIIELYTCKIISTINLVIKSSLKPSFAFNISSDYDYNKSYV